MKNWLLATALMSLSGVAVANVKVVKEGPIVDGKLDDACWKNATWGDRLQGAKLQVREGEGWKDVADGTSDGKWCSRFKLPGPVSPDAIRVTLPAGTVELYEIEVFK